MIPSNRSQSIPAHQYRSVDYKTYIIRRSVTYTARGAGFSVGLKTKQKATQKKTTNINHEETGIVKNIAEIRFLICLKTHIEIALV